MHKHTVWRDPARAGLTEMRFRERARAIARVGQGNRRLVGSVVVFRHGDRTPKQKVKFRCDAALLGSFFGDAPQREVKMKSDKRVSELRRLCRLFQ